MGADSLTGLGEAEAEGEAVGSSAPEILRSSPAEGAATGVGSSGLGLGVAAGVAEAGGGRGSIRATNVACPAAGGPGLGAV